mgnify:CR=1 FL=1
MEKLKIGISIGDINGIGLEVILKATSQPKLLDWCTPVVYGSSKIVSYHKNIVGFDYQFAGVRGADKLEGDRVNVVNCWQDNVNISLGKATEDGGRYAFRSLEAAVADLKAGLIDALVTAPISKDAMHMANFPFPGHTEYITHQFGQEQSLMMMVSDSLRVGLVTNHLPVGNVAAAISKELVLRKIKIFRDSLRNDFGIERPTIAVLGLNPHAGDGGVLGNEEEKIIRPAIVEVKKEGSMVMGPFPADGFFGSGQYNKYDGILAMYHDQGLIPFKLLSFGAGVNFTAGLAGVRTSPDHGTAFDIAGKNEADPSSFLKAMFTAIDIARLRKEFSALAANSIVRKSKQFIEGQEDEIIED